MSGNPVSDFESDTSGQFLYDSLGNQDCKVKSIYAGSTCPGPGPDLLEDWSYDYKNRLTTYRSHKSPRSSNLGCV